MKVKIGDKELGQVDSWQIGESKEMVEKKFHFDLEDVPFIKSNLHLVNQLIDYVTKHSHETPFIEGLETSLFNIRSEYLEAIEFFKNYK